MEKNYQKLQETHKNEIEKNRILLDENNKQKNLIKILKKKISQFDELSLQNNMLIRRNKELERENNTLKTYSSIGGENNNNNNQIYDSIAERLRRLEQREFDLYRNNRFDSDNTFSMSEI